MARAFRKDTLLLKNMVPRLFFFFSLCSAARFIPRVWQKEERLKCKHHGGFYDLSLLFKGTELSSVVAIKFLPKGQDRPVNIIEKIKNIQKHEKIHRIALFLALRRPFFKALFFSKFRNLFLFLTEVHFFSLTRRTRETNEKKNS